MTKLMALRLLLLTASTRSLVWVLVTVPILAIFPVFPFFGAIPIVALLRGPAEFHFHALPLATATQECLHQLVGPLAQSVLRLRPGGDEGDGQSAVLKLEADIDPAKLSRIQLQGQIRWLAHAEARSGGLGTTGTAHAG